MSELIQKSDNRATARWKLLTGVSALALTAYTASASHAVAQDGDRPTVWVELGAQLSQMADSSEPYSPDFAWMRPLKFSPSQKFEKSPRFGLDEYGKITLQPSNSTWMFSASVRYGRSSVNRHVRQQTHPVSQGNNIYASYPSRFYALKYPRAAQFADTTARNSEQHTILDFQAGSDVGLGLFGGRGSSDVSLGIRFAQFIDKSDISIKSDPDWHFKHKYYQYGPYKLSFLVQPYHSNAAGLVADRSFRGVGPSLSWSAAAPIAGNSDEAQLDFDWGVNAAILFGRQKSRTQHHETVRYNTGGTGFFYNPHGTMATVYRHTPPLRSRSRSVVVPNIGGFAGLSFRYAAAKVSFGYKADFFFGAMDGGIDEHKSYDRNFFGPYASISIGLGG